MIGIRKQTQWYVDVNKKFDTIFSNPLWSETMAKILFFRIQDCAKSIPFDYDNINITMFGVPVKGIKAITYNGIIKHFNKK